MGQALFTTSPGELGAIFQCDGCTAHCDFYPHTDFIVMRAQIRADGWRRCGNKWFKSECIPTGKDDD